MESNNKQPEEVREMRVTRGETLIINLLLMFIMEQPDAVSALQETFEQQGLGNALNLIGSLADKLSHVEHTPTSWCHDPECKWSAKDHNHAPGEGLMGMGIDAERMQKIARKYAL